MVFSSPIFLFIFLPAAFVIYRLLPGLKIRNCFLAIISIVFYSFGQLEYVPLFLISILLNYFSGLILIRAEHGRKLILVFSVAANLLILAWFKYTDFLVSNINVAFSCAIPQPGIILPIGISFFTFQGMSYVIDTYRDQTAGTDSFIKVLLYISFFPQLIAGPIVKYHDIAEQIDSRTVSPELSAQGIGRFIVGLSKKVLIANVVGSAADNVFNNLLPTTQFDFASAWVGAFCYSLQIYFDFSGYSDMAIGIGKMFGFSFLENFNFPYGSRSIREFWRKWHISLSNWFREYLYIPLGGNRKGTVRTYFNRMFVFLCTGIWHGANWTFLVWGLCHGILSNLEQSGIIPVDRLQKTALGRIVCRLYTIIAVVCLFVVFRADSMADAVKMISTMFSFGSLKDSAELISLLSADFIFIFVVATVLSGNLPAKVKSFSGKLAAEHEVAFSVINLIFLIILLLLCMMSLARGGFNPFIYFQF